MATEMRLIDANDLWKKADELERTTAEECGWQEMCDGICQVKELIADATTVDAAPVVHGRWIDENGFLFMPLPKGHRWCHCSECGEMIVGRPYNYCPNCGAKMDLKEADNGR